MKFLFAEGINHVMYIDALFQASIKAGSMKTKKLKTLKK